MLNQSLQCSDKGHYYKNGDGNVLKLIVGSIDEFLVSEPSSGLPFDAHWDKVDTGYPLVLIVFWVDQVGVSFFDPGPSAMAKHPLSFKVLDQLLAHGTRRGGLRQCDHSNESRICLTITFWTGDGFNYSLLAKDGQMVLLVNRGALFLRELITAQFLIKSFPSALLLLPFLQQIGCRCVPHFVCLRKAAQLFWRRLE